MKLQILGRTLLAIAGTTGLSLGLTSCTNDKTVGYVYVLGVTANGQPAGQIGSYREDNNNGSLISITAALGSGGNNPIRMVSPTGNRFIYVLNAGTPTTDTTTTLPAGGPNPNQGSITYSSANITLFSVGGYGQLSQQLQYPSQGFGSQRIALDSSGTHLFVLDEFSPVGISNGGINSPTSVTTPGNTSYPCLGTDGFYHPVGDISVYTVDGATGRLQIVQNQRQQNLAYFPVGCFPTDFRLAGGYIFTMDAGSASNNDVNTVNVQNLSASSGQLTPTQTGLQVIGSGLSPAPQITAVTGDGAGTGGGRYIYLIDTPNNRIFAYTIGTNGALTAISGNTPFVNTSTQAGGPVQTVTDSTGKYLYVINGGPAAGTNNSNSDLGVYNVDGTTGALNATVQGSPFQLGTGTISGPVCVFEDPTNQFIYSAGSLDNSITGRKLDPNTGTLRVLNNASTFPTVGTPSWCLGFANAF